MAKRISSPALIKAVGNKPKEIREYIGRVNSATHELSIARMISPEGWIEPGQKPEFDEYTIVIDGVLRVETKSEILDIAAGQSVVVNKGEWVRYSSPAEGGAQYFSVCLPAFSPATVHRDQE